MRSAGCLRKVIMMCAAAAMATAAFVESSAAEPEPPIAGKQIRFEKGYWSALPQVGPDGKVRQCVLVAMRSRAGKNGPAESRFTLIISRGAGFAISLGDAAPAEAVLDDQAEFIVDGGRSFPAVAFSVGPGLAAHPGDAAGMLTALEKASTLTLRSDGAGVDSGPITLDLPGEALGWLKQCGRIFDIAIDRPTDPSAPDMPAPRPRSPKVASAQPTAAGPAGIEDKQKISGWDASELRTGDGTVAVCLIRRHYTTGSPAARNLGTFLMVSRAKGLTMMLKDSNLNQPQGKPIEATLSAGGKPFTGFSAEILGSDEIGIFPQHGAQLALALENGGRFDFKSKIVGLEFPVQNGVVPWLRACARRHGIAIEPGK